MEFGTIELLGGESFDSDADLVTNYSWRVSRFPGRVPPAVVPIDDGEVADVTIRMLGNYQFELFVVDEHGLASCNIATVTVDSVASHEGILIELTWKTKSDADQSDGVGTDVDLHMLPPGWKLWNLPEAAGDCYYANPGPNWGEPFEYNDNPLYYFDDIDGAGPEYISIRQPVVTTDEGYVIGVHFKAAHGFAPPTLATVRLFYNGEWQATAGETALQEGDVWIAAELMFTQDGPWLVTGGASAVYQGFPTN